MAQVEPLRAGDPAEVGGHRLLGRLGSGGQGVVYLAEGESGRVAVKVLRGDRIDARARQRLAKEIAAARRVAPFCVAQIVDADAEADPPYLVSEYVEGRSLAEAGPRSGPDLQRLAVSTATALAAVHEAGIVHRDFKPANVLLGADGPRVIDFGIARSLTDATTLTSQIVGTPSYMAPEQLAGEQVGPAADVFAWGGVILYAATGRAPFGSDTLPAVMHRILTTEPDLSVLEEPLRSIVGAALAKDPAARPTMVEITRRLLGPAVPAAGVSVAPVAPDRRVRRALAGAGAVVVAALLAVLAFVIPHGATAEQPTPAPTPTPSTPPPSTSPPSTSPPRETPTPTPKPVTAFPAAFAGTWTGQVQYQPGATDQLEVTIKDGGARITERYVQYRCTATSRLTAIRGNTATLKRATMKGNCPRNGKITLNLRDGTLEFRYAGHGENEYTKNAPFTMYAELYQN